MTSAFAILALSAALNANHGVAIHMQVIGWSDDESTVAIRVYTSSSHGLPGKCAGYIDHTGAPFEGGLEIRVFKWGRELWHEVIQDDSSCTPESVARARLAETKARLRSSGVDIEKSGTRLRESRRGEATLFVHDSGVLVHERYHRGLVLRREDGATVNGFEDSQAQGLLLRWEGTREGAARHGVVWWREYPNSVTYGNNRRVGQIAASPSARSLVVLVEQKNEAAAGDWTYQWSVAGFLSRTEHQNWNWAEHRPYAP